MLKLPFQPPEELRDRIIAGIKKWYPELNAASVYEDYSRNYGSWVQMLKLATI